MHQASTAFRSVKGRYIVAVALCAAALAGCTSTAPPPLEAMLVERAANYLAARQAGDVDTAYSYLPPSQRAIHSKEQFVNIHGERSPLQGGNLHSVTCQSDGRCVLQRSFSYRFPLPQAGKTMPMSVYINETWVQEGGRWWVLPEQG